MVKWYRVHLFFLECELRVQFQSRALIIFQGAINKETTNFAQLISFTQKRLEFYQKIVYYLTSLYVETDKKE